MNADTTNAQSWPVDVNTKTAGGPQRQGFRQVLRWSGVAEGWSGEGSKKIRCGTFIANQKKDVDKSVLLPIAFFLPSSPEAKIRLLWPRVVHQRG
jgi:hypothetical protein